MKLSIIIPVYNVEHYLHRCLDSVFNQNVSYNEYEVIIVNDGSPDNSATIIKEYEYKYKNIKLINQENSGLSVARNNGLKIASGDFVWFVDSDDWIENNCLDQLFSILTDNIHAVHVGQSVVYDDISLNFEQNPNFNQIKGIEALGDGLIKIQAQLTIYKRLFLLDNGLKFFPNILHEDMEFTPRAYYFAERVISYPYPVYNYYQRASGAITSNPTEKNLKGLKKAIENLIEFESKCDFTKTSKRMWRNNIAAAINEYYRMLNKTDFKRNEKYNLPRKIFSRMIGASKSKYIVEGFLFSSFPSLANSVIK